MLRINIHRNNLNRILRDDRLNANNRMLAEMMLMWLDCNTPARTKNGKTIDRSIPFDPVQGQKEADFLMAIITSQFIDKAGRRRQGTVPEDEAEIEEDATAEEKAIFSQLTGR